MGEPQQDVKDLWEKAQDSLKVAGELLEQGHDDYAATSAYHAAFFAASALLLTGGNRFEAHGAVRAYLHKHHVRKGGLSREAAAAYNALFTLCDAGGRCVAKQIAPAKAKRALEDAKLFLQAVAPLLAEGAAGSA
ncbi:MAG TPA: HEPN domain-containing protein [Planctomycetota bacterium]|nr:HEPN domain-containing protein [Planctomycetota bacterium]